MQARSGGGAPLVRLYICASTVVRCSAAPWSRSASGSGIKLCGAIATNGAFAAAVGRFARRRNRGSAQLGAVGTGLAAAVVAAAPYCFTKSCILHLQLRNHLLQALFLLFHLCLLSFLFLEQYFELCIAGFKMISTISQQSRAGKSSLSALCAFLFCSLLLAFFASLLSLRCARTGAAVCLIAASSSSSKSLFSSSNKAGEPLTSSSCSSSSAKVLSFLLLVAADVLVLEEGCVAGVDEWKRARALPVLLLMGSREPRRPPVAERRSEALVIPTSGMMAAASEAILNVSLRRTGKGGRRGNLEVATLEKGRFNTCSKCLYHL
jgi:hypothetical protein